ncbi:MAG: hypothetical protein COV78_00710 [Candidatus Pacebacteria bacterium CG11_big_fil_rev_8_21_14_0_20_34_55]|nr:MAG: hypothetical protein COV78_00710 [Candidatus Pacebacteria bacterium CG11_big_fil_rev_8_21_14_0_20_34_55]
MIKEQAEDEKQKLIQIGERENEYDNLQRIHHDARYIATRIAEIYQYQIDRFVFQFLQGSLDFKANDYLTFKPNEVVITIGEKKRVFKHLKKSKLETNISSLMGNGYDMKSLIKLRFSGIKAITIPEETLVSKSIWKEEEAIHLVEMNGDKKVVNQTNIAVSYVALCSAIEELLVELNKEQIKTKKPLINPFKGLETQVDDVANGMMDGADVAVTDRHKHYSPATKTVKKK